MTRKSSKTFTYWVDIVGACNLRCPSCPRGNFSAEDSESGVPPSGLMDFDLFKQVVHRIKVDGASVNPQVHLYNWGEPLAHPDIVKFVEHVLGEGIYCGISSNLNVDRNLEEVLATGLDFFRVSMSGFHQASYGQTHSRGNVERVKDNMRRMRDAMDRHGTNTYVEVCYHMYRHNVGDDLVEMAALCNELRFNLAPVWAFFLPIEKNIELLQNPDAELPDALRQLYVITPREAANIAMPYKDKPCPVRDHAIVINHDGTVPLCCNTYDRKHIIADNFLAETHEQLQAKRYDHELCGPCMDNGLHVYLGYETTGEETDALANERLREMGAPLEVHQYSKPTLKRRDGCVIPLVAKCEDEISTRKKIRGLRRVAWDIGNLVRKYG